MLRAMIASTGRTLRPWVLDALRGALVGLAVFGTWYFAVRYADSVIEPHPGDDGLAVLGATVLIVLKVGIPSSAVVGVLAAWAARLRRPWAVTLLGPLNTGLLVCGLSFLQVEPPIVEPRWVLPSILIVLAYAAAAVLAARFAQPSLEVSQLSARDPE